MRARISLKSAALGAMLVVCMAAQANASTRTVTSLADDGSAGTLRSQVAAAAPGDTINFGVTGTLTVDGQFAIPISKDVTITGPGASSLTVDSPSYIHSIFNISSGIVAISGITMTGGLGDLDGYGGRSGGAIYMSAGTVTLTSCVLMNNQASPGEFCGAYSCDPVGGYGGAIYQHGGSLSLVSCTVSGNSAYGGGGIATDAGSLSISKSAISGNNAIGFGGGIHNESDATITDSTINGNQVFYYDPAYVGGNPNVRGAGIMHAGTAMTISNCTISGNSCRSRPDGQGGLYGGGGILHFSGTLTVASSTITNNSVDSGSGGGIESLDTLSLTNTIVAGNRSTSTPAGSDVYGSIGSGDYNLLQTIALVGPTPGTHNIIGQPALLGPLVNHGGPTLTHALLAGSPAYDAGDPNFDPPTMPYDQRGSGFPRVLNGRLDIGAYESETQQFGSSFIVNTLADHDDGICDVDCTLREAVHYAPAAATITFDVAGTITLSGGDIVINKDLTITGPTTVPGITLSGNHARRIFTLLNNGQTRVAFSFLTLTAGNGTSSAPTPSDNGSGGAIANLTGFSTLVTVDNCTFTGNNASANAGAIRNAGALTVTNSTFSGNTAALSGGAIGVTGTLTLANCTFSGNTAGTSGGAIIKGNNAGLALNISNSIFDGNTSPSGPNISGVVTSSNDNLVQDPSGATIPGTHNITGQSALLGVLADHGGPTQTIALLSGSPAIDAGDPAFDTAATPYDQRGSGYPRKYGSAIDIGAFEQQAPASHFDVVAPAVASAGTLFSIAVTARDADGNVDVAFAHAIHFSSSDPSAALPADAFLSSGTAMFSVVLGTAGNQTITTTDATAPSVHGTSNTISVSAGPATHFSVAAPPSAAVGSPFSVSVTAVDQYENAGAVYGGSIHFTSSDASAALPSDSGLGGGTFSATLNTTGSHTITATSTTSATITGTSNAIVVCTFTLSSPSIIAPSGGLSGSFNVTGGPACSWVATSNAAWLTTTSSGTGNGPVSYTVAANPSTLLRIGSIVVGDRTFSVTQSGVLPTSLVAATDVGNASITLTWSSTPVDHYEIWRNAGSGYVLLTTGGTFNGTGGWSFVDNGISPDAAYAYEVRAVDSGANQSDYSNSDLATTFVFTDDPLVAGVTQIKALHITELQNAVTVVRAVAGVGSPSFTHTSPAGLPIAAADIEELREAIDGALSELHIALPAYSPIDAEASVIAAAITEIRAAMK